MAIITFDEVYLGGSIIFWEIQIQSNNYLATTELSSISKINLLYSAISANFAQEPMKFRSFRCLLTSMVL